MSDIDAQFDRIRNAPDDPIVFPVHCSNEKPPKDTVVIGVFEPNFLRRGYETPGDLKETMAERHREVEQFLASSDPKRAIELDIHSQVVPEIAWASARDKAVSIVRQAHPELDSILTKQCIMFVGSPPKVVFIDLQKDIEAAIKELNNSAVVHQ